MTTTSLKFLENICCKISKGLQNVFLNRLGATQDLLTSCNKFFHTKFLSKGHVLYDSLSVLNCKQCKSTQNVIVWLDRKIESLRLTCRLKFTLFFHVSTQSKDFCNLIILSGKNRNKKIITKRAQNLNYYGQIHRIIYVKMY